MKIVAFRYILKRFFVIICVSLSLVTVVLSAQGIAKEIRHDKQVYTVDDRTEATYPELIRLILQSGVLNNQERQYWFDTLPTMSQDEIAELLDILKKGYQKKPEDDALVAAALAFRSEHPPLFAGARGILIMDVVPDSQGAKAGLSRGDIIIRYGANTINSVDKFGKLATNTTTETRIELTCLRNGSTIKVTLAGGKVGVVLADLIKYRDIVHGQQSYRIEDSVAVSKPELIQLILNTESMDAKERQQWFDQLPNLPEGKIAGLRELLEKEQKRTIKKTSHPAATTGIEWLHYQGVLKVESVSGGSCKETDTGSIFVVELVLERQIDPPRIRGYIAGDGMSTGYFTGTDPLHLSMTYPFADVERATGHTLELMGLETEEPAAMLKEKPLSQNKQDCSWNIAGWQGQLVAEGAHARTRMLVLSEQFEERLARSKADQQEPEATEELSLLEKEILAAQELKDSSRFISLNQSRPDLVAKIYGRGSSQHAHSLVVLAETYLNAGQPEQALLLLSQSLEMRASNEAFQARFSLFRTLNRNAEAEAVLAAWDSWLAKKTWNTQRTTVADFYLALAVERAKKGFYEEALRLFNAPLTIDRELRPRFAAAELGWIASLHLHLQRPTEARAAFQEGLAIIDREGAAKSVKGDVDTVLMRPAALFGNLEQRTITAEACLPLVGLAGSLRSVFFEKNISPAALDQAINKYFTTDQSILSFLFCINGFDVGLVNFITENRTKLTRDDNISMLFYEIARPERVGVAKVANTIRTLHLGKIFKKYTNKRESSAILMASLIEGLQVPFEQKIAYLAAIDYLDDSEMKKFYQLLTRTIDMIETDEISNYDVVMGHLRLVRALTVRGVLK